MVVRVDCGPVSGGECILAWRMGVGWIHSGSLLRGGGFV